ncbi:uncharacterized protein [Rutidosis leptorrhynchoides]|uniref:uncharacterized protein n=1 Tax=Rutidosis leptorrhynchoides TaxID=125765 RepID=UPI003A996E38
MVDEMLLQNSSLGSETHRINLLPQKLEVFIWRAHRNRLPVRVELDKKGIDLDSVRCPVCDDVLETLDHVLLNCNFAQDVWIRLYRWWGLSFPSGINIQELLQGNEPSFSKSSMLRKIWQAVIWVGAYKIWKNRNNKLFKGTNWMASMLFQEIQVNSFEWIANRSKRTSLNWLQRISELGNIQVAVDPG